MGKRKKNDSDDDDDDFVMDNDAAFEDDDEDDLDIVIDLAGGASDDDDDDADADGDGDYDDEESPPPKKKAKKETAAATTKKSTAKKSSAATTKKTATKKETTTKKESSSGKSSTTKATGGTKAASKKKDVSIKSEPQARELVFEYLKKTNRPYSVVNLVDNLHGQVKKAMCQKCIDKLVKEGKVTLKEHKKAKVYFMNQELMPVMDKDELKQMDDQIKQLTVQRTELKDQVTALTSEKARYAKAMSNEELTESIRQLEEECERKRARLDKLKSGTTTLANPDDKKKALARLNLYLKHWKQRKGIFKDVLNMVCDMTDQKPAVLLEDLGIDTDESVNAPDMKSLGKLE